MTTPALDDFNALERQVIASALEGDGATLGTLALDSPPSARRVLAYIADRASIDATEIFALIDRAEVWLAGSPKPRRIEITPRVLRTFGEWCAGDRSSMEAVRPEWPA